MTQENVAAAGNTEVPAYFTLVALGYVVDRVGGDGAEQWVAENETLRLVADGPLQLLGLSLMRNTRGRHWQPSDTEIDEFFARFYPSAAGQQ